MSSVRVFAPATVANVVVGFDVLGFALEGVGDTITCERRDQPGLTLATNGGVPSDPARNTAGVAAQAMIDALHLTQGFHLTVSKGIPVSAGMGGSAASAVGAVVALNALLEQPLGPEGIFPFALAGEAAASGAPHADNVAPCLYGGLTAAVPTELPRVVQVPPPAGLTCVLVYPHIEIETRAARAALARSVPLGMHVRQSGRLAGFLAGCYRNNPELVRESLVDELIEPQRAKLIPGFVNAQRAALDAGAWCCSISGSGPSVFAWCPGETAGAVTNALTTVFATHDVTHSVWLSRLGARGARILRS